MSPQDLAALYTSERRKREELEGALQLAAKELTSLRVAGGRPGGAGPSGSAGSSGGNAAQGRQGESVDVLAENLRQAQMQNDLERKKRVELEVRGRTFSPLYARACALLGCVDAVPAHRLNHGANMNGY